MARAVLVSVLVVLLAAAAHCILGATAGAGTLTLTLPALSSLTQTQILYLTAGGLSTDTVLSIHYPHIYTLPQAWRLPAGWAPWRWPPPCWPMGAGAGPVEDTATAPRTGRDARVCRIYVN